MKITNIVKTIAFIAVFAAVAVAGVKNVAVVETEADAQSGASVELTPAEVRLLTAELRREAVKNLPRGKYNVMTSETVYAQGSATLEACVDENCVIKLGNTIGADYIVRGVISKFRTKFALSVEIYETENGNLVASSDPIRSDDVGDLLDKVAPVCAAMYRTFANVQKPAPKPEPKANPKAPATYTLAATVNPDGGGYISRNPDQTNYAPGTRVNLLVTPAKGRVFTGWSGDTTCATNLITITMNNNMTLSANFQQLYKITTNASPPEGGYVTRSPDKASYAIGEDVTINAVHARGYEFTGWSGSAKGTANPGEITINGDMALTANFQRRPGHTLTTIVTPPDGGSITLVPNKETYAMGEDVTIKAVHARGYEFTGWSGSAKGTASPGEITINGDMTLTAHFQRKPGHALKTDATPRGGGYVTRSPNKESYGFGEKVNVTAAAHTGYVFIGWTDAVTGKIIPRGAEGKNNRLTVIINGDMALTANFESVSERAAAANAPAKPKAQPRVCCSYGGGVFFANDFGGGLVYGNEEQVTMPYTGGGAYLFFDAVYAEVFAGYSGGGGKWKSADATSSADLPKMQRSYVNIGVFAKYPIAAYIMEFFPLVGIDYEASASGKLVYENNEQLAQDYATSALWFKLGGGVDFNTTQRRYWRVELLYGWRTANEYETEMRARLPYYAEIKPGYGLTVKAGLGVKY